MKDNDTKSKIKKHPSMNTNNRLSYLENYDDLLKYKKKTKIKQEKVLSPKVRYIIYFLFSALNLVVNMDSGNIPAAPETIILDLDIDKTQLGAFGSLVSTGTFIGGIISFTIINVVSRKWTLLFCLFGIVACLFTFPISSNIALLYTNRVVAGVFMSFLQVLFPVWVDQFAPTKGKTMMFSFLQVAVPLGIVLGYGMTAILLAMDISWKESFRLQSYIVAGGALFILLIPSDYFKTNLIKKKHISSKNKTDMTDNIDKKKKTSLHKALRDEKHLKANKKSTNEYDELCADPDISKETQHDDKIKATTLNNKLSDLEPNNSNFSKSVIHSTNNAEINGLNLNKIANSNSSMSNIKEDSNSLNRISELKQDKLSTTDNNILAKNNELNLCDKILANNDFNNIETRNRSKSLASYKSNETVFQEFRKNKENQTFLEIIFTFPKLMSNPVFAFLVIGLSSLFFVITIIQFWGSYYMIEVLHINEGYVRIAFIVVCITSPTFGVISGGIIISLFGGYESKHSITYCCIGALLSSACSVPACFATGLWGFVVPLWLILYFGGCILPCVNGIIISSAPPEFKGQANSIAIIVSNLFGYIPAPFVYGVIHDNTTNPKLAMITGLLWAFLGLFCILMATIFKFKNNSSNQYNTEADSRKETLISDNNYKISSASQQEDNTKEVKDIEAPVEILNKQHAPKTSIKRDPRFSRLSDYLGEQAGSISNISKMFLNPLGNELIDRQIEVEHENSEKDNSDSNVENDNDEIEVIEENDEENTFTDQPSNTLKNKDNDYISNNYSYGQDDRSSKAIFNSGSTRPSQITFGLDYTDDLKASSNITMNSQFLRGSAANNCSIPNANDKQNVGNQITEVSYNKEIEEDIDGELNSSFKQKKSTYTSNSESKIEKSHNNINEGKENDKHSNN